MAKDKKVMVKHKIDRIPKLKDFYQFEKKEKGAGNLA